MPQTTYKNTCSPRELSLWSGYFWMDLIALTDSLWRQLTVHLKYSKKQLQQAKKLQTQNFKHQVHQVTPSISRFFRSESDALAIGFSAFKDPLRGATAPLLRLEEVQASKGHGAASNVLVLSKKVGEDHSYFITHRIHGASIYGNMDPINIPQMLAYIYIPYMDPISSWFMRNDTCNLQYL